MNVEQRAMVSLWNVDREMNLRVLVIVVAVGSEQSGNDDFMSFRIIIPSKLSSKTLHRYPLDHAESTRRVDHAVECYVPPHAASTAGHLRGILGSSQKMGVVWGYMGFSGVPNWTLSCALSRSTMGRPLEYIHRSAHQGVAQYT